MDNIPFCIKPVTIADKEIFDSYFKDASILNSESTFTNLFMWQVPYNIRYAIIDGCLCIFAKHNDRPESVNFPFGDGDAESALKKILDYFKFMGNPPKIRLYGQSQKEFVEKHFPDTFHFKPDIDAADYVYNIDDLINLPGSKYHAKRNHINKFKSLYDFKYHHMTPDFREDCRLMFNRWCESKRDLIDNIDEQLAAVNRLLDNWESLDIVGGCITVDGQMVAFSFGEVLSRKESIVVIHLEHADVDFQGSFPMINQQFLEHEWNCFRFVNREEDMGLEGLRKAKKSYHPIFMTEKYIATLK